MQYRHIRMTRVVVAAAFVVIAGVTAASYLRHYYRLKSTRQTVPDILPKNAENATVGFNYTKIESGQTVYSIKAWRNLGLKDNKNILEDVEVLVYGRGGDRFDRIHSARALYDPDAGTVEFEGDVTILLSSKRQEMQASRLAESDPQKGLLNKTLIKTSKVTYSQRSNRVDTPAALQFTFNELSGNAVGMDYDASAERLSLERDVRVHWERGTGSPPVEVESGSLEYVKNTREVSFQSGVQLHRGQDTLEAQEMVIRMGTDNRVEQAQARGNPRLKSYSGDAEFELTATTLTAHLREEGKQLDSIVAENNVHGTSRSPSATTEMTAQRLTASFGGGKSDLQQLVGENDVVLKIFPIPGVAGPSSTRTPADSKNQTAFSMSKSSETKILSASRMEIFMRPGGRDFEKLITPVPSTLEMIPAIPSEDRKVVKGDRFEAAFAPLRNTLESFEAKGHVSVDLEPQTPRPNSTHRRTESETLTAHFNPANGLLTRIDQTGNFHFMETESGLPTGGGSKTPLRQATAARARYTEPEEVTTLEGQPQVWDATSKTSARTITLDEPSNQVFATGKVMTIYQNRKSSPAPFSDSEGPVFISADRLVGHTQAKTATYSGNARMWQQDDVVKADEIFLDQNARILLASRHVFSTFLVEETGKKEKKDFVTVTADSLKYDDNRQLAQYQHNVVMKAEMGLLQAPLVDIFLVPKPKPGENRIDHAVARDGVTITQPHRRASSGQAEYFPREEKVVMTGNKPTIFDEEKGMSTGRELTFFIRDDRILVDGDPQTRATSQHKVARQ